MFQSFDDQADGSAGPARIAALRHAMAAAGFDGWLVPRADVHQGEYVADRDARLAWLTGFTGSAGFAAVLADRAGIFVDGRYRLQVRAQVDLAVLTPVDWPEVKLGPWLAEALPGGGRIGFDPWLHTKKEIDDLETALAGTGIVLEPLDNLIDPLWSDQPPAPMGAVRVHPMQIAGESSGAKRARLAASLRAAGQRAAVITLPDSLAWLLNIRGSDVARNPVVQGFAILHDDGHLTLFLAPEKLSDPVRAHLGPEVTLRPPAAFDPALRALVGPVRVDPATAPLQVWHELAEAGIAAVAGPCPCLLSKAIKNRAEIDGMAEAHLRDGAAMAEFLCWLDATAPRGGLTEIDVVTALEGFRRATGVLGEISFDTICGAGPNGAIIHYRVTRATNRAVVPGELLLIDSGGQYPDGTTDVTRTVSVGAVPEAARGPYTRALQGLIAMSRARFARGVAGGHLDALARAPLWLAGEDYDHGTGHGVGAALSVHEGPIRLSRVSDIPLEPGMILSNEPGYYRAGAFGIRHENLIVVEEAPQLGDGRAQLSFRTLTFVPFDTRPLDMTLLTRAEVDWINAYHAEVRARIAPRLGAEARAWLDRATAAI